MKSIFIFLLISSLSAFSLKAQDSLFFRDGKVELGKVTLINKGEISYLKQALPNGPSYILRKGEVERIRFENGYVEFLKAVDIVAATEEAKTEIIPNQKKELEYKDNVVWFNSTEIINMRLSFIYEHYFGQKKKFSFRIPFSASIRDEKVYLWVDGRRIDGNGNISFNSYRPSIQQAFEQINLLNAIPNRASQVPLFNNYGNSFYTGFGFRNYFDGRKRKSFFLGLQIDGGTFVYQYSKLFKSKNNFASGPNIISIKSSGYVGGMIRALFELGGRWNLSERFSMNLSVSIGTIQFLTKVKPIQMPMSGISFNPQFYFGYNFGKRTLKKDKAPL